MTDRRIREYNDASRCTYSKPPCQSFWHHHESKRVCYKPPAGAVCQWHTFGADRNGVEKRRKCDGKMPLCGRIFAQFSAGALNFYSKYKKERTAA